jgi:spermidine synthase
VGVIGLGVGTLAAYGRPDDLYTFYEVNPLVVRIARYDFSYLRESPAKTELVMGDARLSLEREPPRGFDVLAVDAFSGDSIPTHLLTREAFELYFRHLQSDGILAMHISNRYLDLLPVVHAASKSLNKSAMLFSNPDNDKKGISTSSWVLVTNRQDLFSEADMDWAGARLRADDEEVLWTDDYSSMFSVLE